MNQDLAARVDRLLRAERLRREAPNRFRAVLAAVTFIAACAIFVTLLRPSALHSVHRVLEVLTH